MSALPPVTLSELDGIRYLHLDSVWVQGAMRLRQPQFIELEYLRRMLAALLWLDADTLGEGVAVHLGLGAGTLTRFTVHQLGMRTTVVELNPQVIEVNRRWFHVEPHERLQIVNGDAGAWLRTACPPQKVRLLTVDAYDEDAAAPVLDDEAFYADCHAALEHGGVMTVNLFGLRSSFDASASRVAAAFGAQRVWRMQATAEGNTALIAARGVSLPEPELLRERAAALAQRFAGVGLKPVHWPRMLKPYASSSADPAAQAARELIG
jgi:spermidine synthase